MNVKTSPLPQRRASLSASHWVTVKSGKIMWTSVGNRFWDDPGSTQCSSVRLSNFSNCVYAWVLQRPEDHEWVPDIQHGRKYLYWWGLPWSDSKCVLVLFFGIRKHILYIFHYTGAHSWEALYILKSWRSQSVWLFKRWLLKLYCFILWHWDLGDKNEGECWLNSGVFG